MKSVPKIFCLDDKVGLVYNQNFYALVTFNKRKFKCLLIELIKSKKFFSADVLLKTALKQYMGVEEFRKRFQDKGITDSQFYMKWRNLIKNHEEFKVNAQCLLEHRQEWRNRVNEGRIRYLNMKMSENERFLGVAKARRRIVGQI